MMRIRLAYLLLVLCCTLLPESGHCDAATATTPPARPTALDTNETALADHTETLTRALVQVEYNASSGQDRWSGHLLGMLVDKSGLILTHGILRRSGSTLVSVEIRFFGKTKKITATYLGKDEDTDLAFLKIPADSIPDNVAPLHFPADTPNLRAGAFLGQFGLLELGGQTQSLLQTGRLIARLDAPLSRYLTDLSSRLASSCAPVFDRHGTLVGIVAPNTGSTQTSLQETLRTVVVVPAPILAGLIANPPEEKQERKKQQGWLGILMGALPPELASHWSLDLPGGVVVSQVLDQSPAQKAGLQAGDIITSFNKHTITVQHQSHLQSFIRIVKETPTGEQVPVHVLRPVLPEDIAKEENFSWPRYRFRPVTLTLTLGMRPPSALYQEYYQDMATGLTLKEISLPDRIAYHLANDVQGMMVMQVEDGSWAMLAGLMPGDIISRINDKPVKTLNEYRTTLNASLRGRPQAILLFLHRGGGTVFCVLKPQY